MFSNLIEIYQQIYNKIAQFFYLKRRNKHNQKIYDEFTKQIQELHNKILLNIDKIALYLNEIEAKESAASEAEIEISFLMPIHQLNQQIAQTTHHLQQDLQAMLDFFAQNILNQATHHHNEAENDFSQTQNLTSYGPAQLKNKQYANNWLNKIKNHLFILNNLFYQGLKFDELIDIEAFNEQVVINVSGLDRYNHPAPQELIFNEDNFMNLLKQISEATNELQKKLY